MDCSLFVGVGLLLSGLAGALHVIFWAPQVKVLQGLDVMRKQQHFT